MWRPWGRLASFRSSKTFGTPRRCGCIDSMPFSTFAMAPGKRLAISFVSRTSAWTASTLFPSSRPCAVRSHRRGTVRRGRAVLVAEPGIEAVEWPIRERRQCLRAFRWFREWHSPAGGVFLKYWRFNGSRCGGRTFPPAVRRINCETPSRKNSQLYSTFSCSVPSCWTLCPLRTSSYSMGGCILARRAAMKSSICFWCLAWALWSSGSRCFDFGLRSRQCPRSSNHSRRASLSLVTSARSPCPSSGNAPTERPCPASCRNARLGPNRRTSAAFSRPSSSRRSWSIGW